MDEELTPVVARRLVDAMTPAASRPQASQALADVTRADADGRVWVRLLGADVDTPVSTVLVAASVGQRVMVTVSGGRATIVGNASSPSVGEKVVDERVRPVSTVAAQAQEMAVSAKIAAGSAASDAAVARTSAESAQADAQIARDSADSAVADAATAKASAQAATDAAGVARQEAEAASASAAQANTAANDALVQLGVVQDVTGTLAWVTEHGTYELTQDATVQDGKAYFVRTGAAPYTYVLVSEPRDADIGTYYELSIDEALSQYVSSHLALTDAGLYVTKDASGYRVLLANDGMSVVDPQGHTVAKYGTGTTFASDRDWYVGNANAFVFYDASEGTLQIGGSDVTIGGKAPDDLLTSLDVSVTQTATGADITVNGDTVHLANGAKGDTGKGVSSITEYYALNNSTTAPSDGSFSTGVKTPTASNRYVWNYELITYTDSSTAKTPKHIAATYGETGSAGKGITSIVDYYAVNNSTTAPADSAFSTTVGTPTATNRYLWNYELTTYTDSTTSKTGKRVIGVYGEKGIQGETGATGPQGATGPEAVVKVEPTAIDWTAGTATLRATLWVNGASKTSGVTYKWTKGDATTSIGTSRTLSVTDLNARYHCACTW